MENINDKIQRNIELGIQKDLLSNNDLVQIIELCGNYLNIQTIPDYAKSHNLSYNGVKKTRTTIKIFNVKFVIDNL